MREGDAGELMDLVQVRWRSNGGFDETQGSLIMADRAVLSEARSAAEYENGIEWLTSDVFCSESVDCRGL
jgi:hypothetical protein